MIQTVSGEQQNVPLFLNIVFSPTNMCVYAKLFAYVYTLPSSRSLYTYLCIHTRQRMQILMYICK